MIRLSADLMSFHHITPPAINTSHAAHGAANSDHRACSLGQLLTVSSLLQLLGCVGDSRKREGRIRLFYRQRCTAHYPQ